MRKLILMPLLGFFLSACVATTDRGTVSGPIDPAQVYEFACGVRNDAGVQTVAAIIRQSGGKVGSIESLVHDVSGLVCPAEASSGRALARVRAAMQRRGVHRALVMVR